MNAPGVVSNEQIRIVAVLREDQERLWALFRPHPYVLEKVGLLPNQESIAFIAQDRAEELLTDIEDFGYHAKLDSTRAPADIARWQVLEHEIRCSARYADESFRLELCIHEALHAVYYERSGYHSVKIGGPYIKAYGAEYADAHVYCLEPAILPNGFSNSDKVLGLVAPEYAATELKKYDIKVFDGYDSDRDELRSYFPGGCEDSLLRKQACDAAREIITEDCKDEVFRNNLTKKAHEFKIDLEEIVFEESRDFRA